MSSNAINIRALNLRRGRFALDNIDLVVPRGSIVGFAGPNGAGKTTTIKAVLGLISPDSGSVTLFDGLTPTDARIKDRIGVVFDQPTVAPGWKLQSIGQRFSRVFRGWDSENYESLLRRFGLSLERRAGELSRGEAVKLGLALAMAHNPELLVLDEPTTGLDPVSRAELADLLREWMTDGTRSVLFSTHIISELDNLADYVQIIHDGRIVLCGQLDDLHDRFAVARGPGLAPGSLVDHLIGPRQDLNRWDALIEVENTVLFGQDVIVDAATTEEIVTYFARRVPGREAAA
jgi:ABC-2 type transport system ATP-binding protein